MTLTQKEILEKNKAMLEAQLVISNNRYALEQDQLTQRLAKVNEDISKLPIEN